MSSLHPVPLALSTDPLLYRIPAALGIGIWDYDHSRDRLILNPEIPVEPGGENGHSLPGETSFSDWLARIHEEDQAAVRQAVADAMPQGVPFAADYRWRDAGGHWAWKQLRGQVVQRDAQAQPLRSFGLITDISTQKRQQEYLDRQQAFTRVLGGRPDRALLVDAILDTVLALSEPDGGGLFWRQADGRYDLIAHRGLSPAFADWIGRLDPGSDGARLIEAGRDVCSCRDGGSACTHVDLIHTPQMREEGIESLVVLPIAVAGKTGACLFVVSKKVRSQLREAIAFLHGLAGQFGQALEHLQSQEEARRQRHDLERRESYQRATLDATADGILLVGDDGRVHVVNRRFQELWRVPDELLARRDDGALLAFVLDQLEDPEGFLALVRRLYRSDEATFDSLRFKDGRLFERYTMPLSVGGCRARVWSFRDVTERERAQAALERERRLLSTLFQTLPDPVWLKDRDGVYLACNAGFERFFGAREADIRGKTDYDFVDRALADSFRAHDQAAMAAGRPCRNEEELRFRADRYRGLFETTKTPLYDGEGRLVGVLGIAHDVTAARVQEAALRKAEEQRRQLMNSSRDGLMILDREYRVIEVNQRQADMLGYAVDELIGRQPWQWDAQWSEEDIGAVFPDPAQVNITFETVHRRKDGSVYDAEISSAAALVDGQIVILAVARDITDRKRADAALRDSEARFRSLFSNMSQGVFYQAADGRLTDINPAACRLLGLNHGAFLETTCESPAWEVLDAQGHVMPPDRHPSLRALRRGEPVLDTLLAVRNVATGRFVWLIVNAIPEFREGETRPFRVFVTLHDVTASRAAARALEESEERLSALFRQASDGIVLIDLETLEFPEFNEAACAHLGYTREEFAALGLSSINPDMPPDEMRQKLRQMVETGALDFETGHRHKDGSLRAVRVTNRPVHAGGRTYAVAIWTDITEQKRQQARLDEAMAFLRESQAIAKVGGWKANPATGWVLWTEEVYRLLEHPLDLPPDPVAEGIRYFALEFRSRVLAALAHTFETGEPFTLECRMIARSGREFWAELRCIGRVEDSEGGTCLTGTFQDITERKRTEMALQRHRQHLEEEVAARTADLSIAKEAAEAASRAKSTFLANMSHELRTPMNAILGLTGLALRRADDPKLKDQLTKIDQASRHLLAVINDILDISKIEAERLTLEQTDFRVGELLENLWSLVEHRAVEKGLELRFNISPEVSCLTLQGDPLRLGQILLNLASNAVKFTPAGTITVQVRRAEEGPRHVALRFEVRDSGIGIGIGDADKPRLFSAFEQADRSMTRKYGGTGLGLAISKRLVALMGGEIGVESRLGEGSCFWFTVHLPKGVDPVASAASGGSPAAEAQLKHRFAGARILLAEDEPINQEVSRELLESVDLRVDLAADGEAAVALAQSRRYDLILMDIQMPKANGLDATRAIRQHSLNLRTPILAITANAFDEDRQLCQEAGMNDHLGKPIDPEALFETLLKWLVAPRSDVGKAGR